jgi:hypothetical protein
VTKLVFGVKDALVQTSGDLHEITSNLKKCFAKVLAQVSAEMKAVDADVVDCIEHGPQTTTTEVEETTEEPETTEQPEVTTEVEHELVADTL